MAEKTENVVIFPLMAQGHMIPFLALALQIEQRKGYSITFINTPLNINNLRSSLPPNSSINLLPIPFSGADHGLPPGTENTDVLTYPLIYRFVQACSSFKPAFRRIISDLVSDERRPLCIIADMFFPWTADVAHEFGISHAIFCGGGGFGFACYYSLWLNLPHKKNPDEEEFPLPDFPEAGQIHRTQLAVGLISAGEDDPWTGFQLKTLPKWANADAVLFNTVGEFDYIGLSYFRRKLGRPVWSLGPVNLSRKPGKQSGISSETCIEWLSRKPSNSVLYISFGSQNTVSASQMMQLATALENSGKNFIWVIKPPLGFDINCQFKAGDWLPEGFEDRIRDQNRGLLVHKWAPQVEILSHGSISAFLSHCGWNSVLEALSQGVPIIGWPMAADQFYNVKLLKEKMGVCVEVARGGASEVRHEDIVEKIEIVMGETEKGKEIRRKAGEARDMIWDAIREQEGCKGSSVKAMDEFFDAAVSMRKEMTQNDSF
ncbi:UDP-glycosyltransferase 92A1-like [Malania oleifera]|uniref:UDP-glycosyltransferase 92A1-like n=1 Tax=Malania oleifera TaxID=397392 RepID=UPI0025ADC2FC|nr:UDP-glycosyltransferase 92A1-like [Malania oleifera]